MASLQSRKRRRLNDNDQQELTTDHTLESHITEIPTDEDADDDTFEDEKSSAVLASDKVSETRATIAKSGVIYLSRIPPRLSPTKIRQLLSPYGSTILRIFLAPESTAEYSRRVKSGGSKRRQFTEGWVEFQDKKVAKKVAGLLNAQRIGTKKGDFWYDDLWCIKYLPKFKWHHLTEQIAYQNASRKEKLRNEIAQEKRENLAFVQNTERSKMIQNIQRKKQIKEPNAVDTAPRRRFIQTSVVQDSNEKASRGTVNRIFV